MIVLAVAGVIALIAKFAGNGGGVDRIDSQSTNARKKVIKDFPLNEVTAISIQDREKSVNVKIEGDKWVVAERENFPANPTLVANLLRHVWDLKITQPVAVGPSHLGRLELTDPAEGKEGETATVMTFNGKDGKEINSLWLGKVHEKDGGPNPYTGGRSMEDVGRYVKKGGSNGVYLVSETFGEVDKADPTDWLTDKFFKIEQIKSIEIKTGTPEDDWKLERNDLPDDFELVDAKENEELDQSKISSIKSAFLNPSFDDVITGEKPKTDEVTWKITTLYDWTYTVSVGEKDDLNTRPLTYSVEGKIQEKRVPGEEEDDAAKKHLDEQFEKQKKERTEKLALEKSLADGRVYKIRSSTIDSYIKKRSELLKEEEKPDAPESPGVQIPGLPPGTQLPPGLQNPGQ